MVNAFSDCFSVYDVLRGIVCVSIPRGIRCCEDARAVQQGCHFLVPDSILVSGEEQALQPRSGALRGTQLLGYVGSLRHARLAEMGG